VDVAQRNFLANDPWAAPRGSTDAQLWSGALEDALRSAHGRAYVYAERVTEGAKEPFKRRLRSELTRMGQAYASGAVPLTQTRFESDMKKLVKDMNRDFASLFS
jgi:hypothetical protein